MKKYFERASSVERRFISATLLVLFLALNWIFVWPLFSDWKKFEDRRETAQRKLKLFETAIAQAATLKPKVAALEGEGMAVPPEAQTVAFMQTIQSQAAASGVTILTSVSQQPQTKQFFIEKAQALTLMAGEQQLVDFLYRLGTGESLVRVRGLSLRPDSPHYALTASLTLVANYQKKAAVRAATPPPANPPAPVTKPATTATEKPKSTPPAKTNQPAGPGVPKPSKPTKK